MLCYRRYWRVDLLIAAALIGLSVLCSRQTVDMGIAHWFFNRSAGGWPDATRFPWQWLYDVPPVILALVIPTCMILLFVSALRLGSMRIRIRSIYLLLALWLGAGLLIEGIFKMNWGRPKPAQLLAFGGWLDFHATFEPGVAGRGRSFPSGHSAIGYYLTAFYFMLRRDRPRWAVGALIAGLALGTTIGIARIRVGGHFASDVAWSAAIMYTVNLLVYYALLNVPAYEDSIADARRPRRPWGSLLLLILVPAAIQAFVLTLSPIHRSICHELPSGSPPDAVRLVTAGAAVELRFVEAVPLRIEGEWVGRGFAGASLESQLDVRTTNDNRMAAFECRRRGWFYRSGGLLRVRLPSDHVTRLTLDTARAPVHFAPGSMVPTNTVIDIRSGRLID